MLACLVVAAGAPAAAADTPALGDEAAVRPVRDGFTIELDGGLGATHVTGTEDGIVTRPSFGGIDVALGGFATPDVALLFRFSAQTFWVPRDTPDLIAAHATAGPALEWWIDDPVFVSLGVGLGVEGGQVQDGSTSSSAIGLGASARAGYALAINPDTAWRISVEVTYGMLEARRAYSGAVLFGWQSF